MAPTKAPEGLSFNNYYQSAMIQNMTNLNLSNQFTVAMWVKIIPDDQDNIYVSLFSMYRYDQGQVAFGIYLFGNSSSPTYPSGYTAFRFLMYPNSYQTVDFVMPDSYGWYYIAISFAKNGANTNAMIRMRSANGGSYTQAATLNFLMNFANTDYYDAFVGSYCSASWINNYGYVYYYSNSFNGIVSRLYIWYNNQNLAQPGATSPLDIYLLGYKGGSNACPGVIPCSFCSLELVSNVISCTTEGKSNMFMVNWDFDVDDEQYIKDISGNGINLVKNSLNDAESAEPMKVFGQGYLFEANSYATAQRNILFSGLNYFTVEAWIRVNNQYTNPGSQKLNLFTVYNFTNSIEMFQIIIYNSPAKIEIYTQHTASLLFYFPNMFASSDWQFFGFSFSSFFNQGYWKPSLRVTVAVDKQIQSQSALYLIDTASDLYSVQYITAASGSFYIKSLKFYNISKLADELNAEVQNSSCTPASTTCTYCPAETGQCIQKCNQNTYGSSCLPCNAMCGHCSGPTINDCYYCSRDQTKNIIYSESFGNCTCKDGFYLDTSSYTCKACSSNCSTCFGPATTQCLSCASGSVYFYPVTTCVQSCSDSLITAGSTLGHYQLTQANGLKICATCHPYCSVCSGSSNAQCTSCQSGYFLKGGNTCYNSCPSGQYPNTTSWTCLNCDPTCASCIGGTSNQCLTCTSSALVQQDNVCQATCNYGYYANAFKMCLQCDSACSACSASGSQSCSACNTGYYLSNSGFSCGTSCASGTYADSTSNSCLLCHYSCKTCTAGDAASCIQCQTGYLIRGNLCVTSCQAGEFIVNGECQTCDSKCTTCFGTENGECYNCNLNPSTGYGYFLNGTTCLDECPDGYYPDTFTRTCKACPTECETCTSYDFCTSCIYGPYQLNDGECSFFYCLNGQYRTIRPQLACFDCDESCGTCQGATQFDCLSCPTSYIFYQNQCSTCSEQPGMTDPVQEGQTGCVEICGDGFNYGQYQCDDGNTINWDGCSSKCLIESGWTCEGGSEYGPDVCTFVKNPTPQIALINSKNQIYIQFDSEVTLMSTLDSNSLSIAVTGPQPSYDFQWSLNDKYKVSDPLQVIMIDMTFYTTLQGSNKESIIVKFINSEVYVDNSGNGVSGAPMNGYLSAYTYIDPVSEASMNAAGSNTMLVTIGAMALNLGISLIFGGSISAMWTMVNTVQLISLLPLMNVDYPPLVILIFSKMLSSQGETTAIPNVIFDYGINATGFVIESPLNDQFTSYGWSNSNFIELSGRKVLIWAVLILSYPFVLYMKNKFSDKHKYCKLWEKLEKMYRYNLLLRGVIVSYASMMLAALLNVFDMQFSSIRNMASLFTAITFLIILVYLPIQLMNILQRNYSKVHTKKFMSMYSTIIKELDVSIPLRYMYYPVFLLRRTIFVIILVLFANSPKSQIAIMSGTSLVMIAYILIIRPQREKIMIVLTASGEIILLIIHLISIAFLDTSMSTTLNTQLGWLIIVLVGLYILINWVVIVVITVIDMRANCKKNDINKAAKKAQQKKDAQYLKWKAKEQLKRRKEREEERQRMIKEYQKKENSFMHVNSSGTNYLGGSQLPDSKYMQIQVEQLDQTGNNNNYNEYESSESPNPFYNPNKHHEIEEASLQIQSRYNKMSSQTMLQSSEGFGSIAQDYKNGYNQDDANEHPNTNHSGLSNGEVQEEHKTIEEKEGQDQQNEWN